MARPKGTNDTNDTVARIVTAVTRLMKTKKDKPMADPIQTAHLIAPTSRRQAFYRLWIEANGQGFRVIKESGAGSRVLHRQVWEFSALPDAEKLFTRRVREKTNTKTKRIRRYQPAAV